MADNLAVQTQRAALEACERLLGIRPVRAELTSGGRLKSLRVHLPDRTVIATRRKSPQRAELEAAVLGALNEQGAPVPTVLAFDGTWLIQEDLGTRRLSRVLRDAGEDSAEELLDRGLDSLSQIHAAAAAAGLPSRIYTIGAKPGWLERLIQAPAELGEDLGVPAPPVPTAALLALLSGTNRSFVKWDARPANACVRQDGSIAWFDWEHCGRRNRLDDLAWVLCDERVPDRQDIEERLIARYFPIFDDGGYDQGAVNYLYAFGTFHACIRLSIVLGSWLDSHRDAETAPLSPGRRMDAIRLVTRAGRWAGVCGLTSQLAPWFAAVADRLQGEATKPS